MNGAELPCGSAMGVEPADMNYKKKNSTEQQRIASTLCQQSHSTNDNNGHGTVEQTQQPSTEDDLDDFFASL